MSLYKIVVKSNNTTELERLRKTLRRIEAELEKVRGVSPLTDGWQTQRLAKKQRKWDILAQEKFQIKKRIEVLENDTV